MSFFLAHPLPSSMAAGAGEENKLAVAGPIVRSGLGFRPEIAPMLDARIGQTQHQS
jgi:hypothetical protein